MTDVAAEERLHRLSILDGYGVRWSREAFARDVLQNFFDAARTFGGVTIDVDDEAGRVVVRGDAEFDVDLLCYVGATTKKDGKTAGGFGEGFKVCALVALRDFGARLCAGSGERALTAVLLPVSLGRELCYRESRRPGARGSFVEIDDADAALRAAFRGAKDLFRHPNNPRIGPPIAVSEDGAASIGWAYASEGDIYYRGQRRGTIHAYSQRPYTLILDVAVPPLEGDRDRTDLRPDKVAALIAERLPDEGLERVIMALSERWKYGDTLLGLIVTEAVRRGLTFEFPPGYLAREQDDGGLGALAARQGFELCVGYLAKVGMPLPRDHYRGRLETRAPTPLERGRYLTLERLYDELTGEKTKPLPFEVFPLAGAAVAGQHLGEKIIVAEEHLAGPFTKAAGTVLHELSHEKGGETSEGFLSRLEQLIGAAMAAPSRVRAAERDFALAEPVPEAALPVAAEPEVAPPVYSPEQPRTERLPSRRDQPVIVLAVPPAWPGSEEIVAMVERATSELGVDVAMMAVRVTSAAGARLEVIDGLPCLYAGRAVAGGPDRTVERSAYAPRLWDHGGTLRPMPPYEAVVALVARASKLGQRALLEESGAVHEARDADERARLGEAERAALERFEAFVDRAEELAGELAHPPRPDLGSIWLVAWDRAMRHLVARRPLDEDAGAMRRAVQAAMEEARMAVGAWASEWPPVFQFDPFEAALHRAAQGAALFAFVTGGAERSRGAHAEVRWLGARSQELRVPFSVRESLLAYVLHESGLSWIPVKPSAWQAGRACALFERLGAEVEAQVRAAQRAGRGAYVRFDRPPHQAPSDLGARSLRLRAVWDEALASGQSEAEAMEVFLAAAPELVPSMAEGRLAVLARRYERYLAGDFDAVLSF